ncbi:hypothetical protein [Bacillus sp. SA1-12]|uniref:hypothetical protein n=1 Tax=Bacillus sp. SA1-12 TaxID=1455638 RepID=UPI000A810555|nr:hypothetical protein [Bacillus sp. SA1-12]
MIIDGNNIILNNIHGVSHVDQGEEKKDATIYMEQFEGDNQKDKDNEPSHTRDDPEIVL